MAQDVAAGTVWRGRPRPALWAAFIRGLLTTIEVVAAALLVADLLVVVGSVLSRHFLDAPLVWTDDIARTLLLAVTFLGQPRRWRGARTPVSPSS